MTFDPASSKHQAMRTLLFELGVPDPESGEFYSQGGTVTEAAVITALTSFQNYKSRVRNATQTVINLTN